MLQVSTFITSMPPTVEWLFGERERERERVRARGGREREREREKDLLKERFTENGARVKKGHKIKRFSEAKP